MLLALLVVLCLFSSGYSQTYPSSVLVPSNAITDVSFTCNVSSPEWRVNGTMLHFGNIPLGISPTMSEGIPALTVSKTYVLRYNETSIQCRQHDGENWSSIPAAFIRVYGPPSEPSDLSSESGGVLVFSWSPPWAPDGVQLNYVYTVTVTSSEVTVFTTSDTNIILTRDNITSVNSSSSPSSSSQCDQYVWCVTAVNPAGISGPANYTTAVSLIPTFSQAIHGSSVVACDAVLASTLRSFTTASPLLSFTTSHATVSSILTLPPPTIGPEMSPIIMTVAVIVLIAALALILVVGIIILCCRQKMKSVKTSTHERQEVSEFANKHPTINTDENVAYGTSIGLNNVGEVQYEQVDVPTADSGFTMSTNTAYSTITHH